MITNEWIDGIDRSLLLRVIPVGATVERDGVLVEFISVEHRAAGGVLILRIGDASLAGDGDPFDMGVPIVRITTAQGADLTSIVVASDFMKQDSVRHRVVFGPFPEPEAGELIAEVTGFELTERYASMGPWRAPPIS